MKNYVDNIRKAEIILGTAKKYKTNLSIIKSTIKSNDQRQKTLFNRVKKILKNKINNKKITFLGVTFKPNTDDMREATSLKMIKYLSKKGAFINYNDPSGSKKILDNIKKVKFHKSIMSACNKTDLIIIHTEWNEYKQLNFKKLVNKNNFKVYDMRNLYSPAKMQKLKIKYFGIGR